MNYKTRYEFMPEKYLKIFFKCKLQKMRTESADKVICIGLLHACKYRLDIEKWILPCPPNNASTASDSHSWRARGGRTWQSLSSTWPSWRTLEGRHRFWRQKGWRGRVCRQRGRGLAWPADSFAPDSVYPIVRVSQSHCPSDAVFL